MTDTTHDRPRGAHAATSDEVDDRRPGVEERSRPRVPAGDGDLPAPPLTRGARIGAAVSLLVVALYVATTILMAVPQDATTRALTAPARPYFGQQWNVFAPSIQKTNRYLEMQGQWRDDS
jgi:hypothetical protein